MNHNNDNAPAIVGGGAHGPRALDLFSAAAGGWSLTEEANAARLGFFRYWDCGHERLLWRRD